ncbi:MAG: hypothetical protein WDW38_001241 [Sanguina aurantia]
MCLSMPTMKLCSKWTAMCAADPTLYLCTASPNSDSSSSSMMMMNMYFNDQRPFFLVFKGWVPTTNSQYIGAWIAVFVLGLTYELIQVMRSYFEAFVTNLLRAPPPTVEPEAKSLDYHQPQRWCVPASQTQTIWTK